MRAGLFSAIPVDVAQPRISVMGGEQAASVLATVRRDMTPEESEAFKARSAHSMRSRKPVLLQRPTLG